MERFLFDHSSDLFLRIGERLVLFTGWNNDSAGKLVVSNSITTFSPRIRGDNDFANCVSDEIDGNEYNNAENNEIQEGKIIE